MDKPWEGKYVSQSTGRMRYNPEENPDYKAEMERRKTEALDRALRGVS